MIDLNVIRSEIQNMHLADEKTLIEKFTSELQFSRFQRGLAINKAKQLIDDIRADNKPALLEVFLAEYGLSTEEGVALMCMAEALMRTPDNNNIDELIDDKIATADWQSHRGQSESMLVNSSTLGLMVTGKILSENSAFGRVISSAVKRVGKPIIRLAIKRAMKELGGQFVLGETIEAAVKRANKQVKAGYSYSYDMLGEAALTRQDAHKFFDAYKQAIECLAAQSTRDEVAENPGISIKLSALHPRYEVGQKQRVMKELVSSTLQLTLMAKNANLGLNIDAEESDRLDLSLDVIEAVLQDKRLAGWDGFGVVVQAYGKRAGLVIDWLEALAQKYNRKIMVRLVKGAYWDTEIKRSQVEGLSDFPVFTQKSATDCSYLYCAEKLLNKTRHIYPQFATHNANTIAAILTMAGEETRFEFQRLHGMGEALHRLVKQKDNVRCRIYAPVGPHKDLLAYLVRRLLENGANSSFVNQIVDSSVPAADMAEDAFMKAKVDLESASGSVSMPNALFGIERANSKGWDLHDECDKQIIENARGAFRTHQWAVAPITARPITNGIPKVIKNPALPGDQVGTVIEVQQQDLVDVIEDARDWGNSDGQQRADVLRKAADLFEQEFGQLFAALTREAGKTPADAIAEVREAVDFLRFYAAETEKVAQRAKCGIFACISPWNFPLAIFTGQIAAALAAGNGVLAKPAEQTPVSAWLAVSLLIQAGVPAPVLQLVPGSGRVVGAELASAPKVKGMCFTGSTATAKKINKNMARHLSPDAPLIAETGGLNAMIVDSTALPEQVIKDVIDSAFQSAGQRCSALRVLYLQRDIAQNFERMLLNAMDELVIGDPWEYETDIGPVIDDSAHQNISAHIDKARHDNRLVKQMATPEKGCFIGPTVIRVNGIGDLEEEIFGPVLHIATYEVDEIDQIVNQINDSGYGLTFGLHTRINKRVEQICSSLHTGNIYVNRNQIGAVVGSQPFGGEGLSGTGPKAGGPNYIKRFTRESNVGTKADRSSPVAFTQVEAAIAGLTKNNQSPLSSEVMLGPTGESNILSYYGRGIVLCLGPTVEQAKLQALIAKDHGCTPLIVTPGYTAGDGLDGFLVRDYLTELTEVDAVVCWSDGQDLCEIRQALASRKGAIIPLITEQKFMAERLIHERHVCIDTTASGGNAELLALSS